MHRTAIALGLLVGTVAIPVAAAPESKSEAPTATTKAEIPAAPLAALKVTTEDGYHIEEGLFRVKIKGRLYLLQGLIVKKVDAIGRLPIMLSTHGTTSSPNGRQQMTPRGARDANVRMLRDYARRGWLVAYVLRRGYGQSDGPAPVGAMKCDSNARPSFQDFINADADDLEATLAYIAQREDADPSRVMSMAVSGGGAAVVALGARNIPGVKLVVNVSGGQRLTTCSDVSNHDHLVAAMRHFGATSRVTNLWYYAKNDRIFPEQTVVDMREAFLEAGGYAKLVHYEELTDLSTNQLVDGHQLWSKRASTIMIDVDGYLRGVGLPTWDFKDVKSLADRIGIKDATPPASLEFYLASPGFKALAQSTTKATSLGDVYKAATLEAAKQGALANCQKRNPGHTCQIVDPPEEKVSPPAPPAMKSPELTRETRPDEEPPRLAEPHPTSSAGQPGAAAHPGAPTQ